MNSSTLELLDESEGTSTIKASVPPVTTYMATIHKHPVAEEIEVVSGRMRLRHGYRDPFHVDEPGPGERMAGGPNEWPGIANASTSEPLVVLRRHTPGHKWAEFVRQGASAVEQLGKFPDGFLQAQFPDIGVVVKP